MLCIQSINAKIAFTLTKSCTNPNKESITGIISQFTAHSLILVEIHLQVTLN